MAVEIGKFNNLQVVKVADHGVYVDGGEEGTILLPNRYVPEGTEIDDWVEEKIKQRDEEEAAQ